MVVIDDFDKGLDFWAFLDALLAHTAGDFWGVAFDAGDEGVCEGMGFCASVLRLDYNDLPVKLLVNMQQIRSKKSRFAQSSRNGKG